MNEPSIGRYEIRDELGRGGMATVYRAHDPRFDRDVALKTLSPELLHDPTFRTRFEIEARTIAALEHSGIVPVYDFGDDNGQPYLVMRLMTSGSLADRLRKGPLSLAETARILSRLAPALDYAHQKGVIHRDLKPANILFDQHGDPYLSDFGIAKLAESTASLTGKGIVGTPAYMSPEQGRGEPGLDGATDIYALGAILFEMLTGRVPYESTTPTGQLIRHITDPIPDIHHLRPGLPPATQMVIARSMAKRKYARYPRAVELAADVTSLASGKKPSIGQSQGTVSLPAIDLPSTKPNKKRNSIPVKQHSKFPFWPGWVAGGLVVLALLAFVFWPNPQSAVPPTHTPSPIPSPTSPTALPTPAVWAVVESTSGPLAQVSDSDQNPTMAVKGNQIVPGQAVLIQTGNGSMLKLRLTDGSVVYVNQNTRLFLSGIAGTGSASADNLLTLEEGTVLVVSQRLIVNSRGEFTGVVSDGVMGVTYDTEQTRFVVDCLGGACSFGQTGLQGGAQAGSNAGVLISGQASFPFWQDLQAALGGNDVPLPTDIPTPTPTLEPTVTGTPTPTKTVRVIRPTFTPTKKPGGGGGGG